MLIKCENSLLSFGLILMLYQVMVRAAVVQQFNNSVISEPKEEVIPLTAANVQNNVIIPLTSASHVDTFSHNPSNYPHGQFNNFNREPIPHSSHPMLRRGDEFLGDQRLPVEDPDYYYYADNPSRHGGDGRHHRGGGDDDDDDGGGGGGGDGGGGDGGGQGGSGGHYGQYRQKPTKKPKKLYKAIERVYYYPHSDNEPARNKDAMNQMKEFIPEEPIEEDPNEEQEQEDVEPRKDYNQMNDNPPRGDHEEPEEDEVYASDGTGTKTSIARDVREFGKEAVDEAKGFEKFLDNLKQFADNSEKEYSSPSEGLDSDDDSNMEGLQESEEEVSNPRYSDSLAAHTADDRTRDYEKISNYGNPDKYNSEKDSYENQKDREQRGGHRYHKDRRRPRKSNAVPDEEYERRNREVSGLIDSEPEEGDYLSNFDVVKQMKNSEQKYNTGIDPIYSSKRDFDEVTRLEKMIENVALLNKQKEKVASNSHDRNEGREGSESKTQITKVPKKDGDKKDKP